MTPKRSKTIYTIPPGLSFVESISYGLMNLAGHDPVLLSRMRVLLPTRRACRALRDAFLKQSKGVPLLLPAMHPIGDVDETELSLAFPDSEEFGLLPAISPIRRQILLSQMVGKMDPARKPEQNLALAQALIRLMDQVYTEELDLAALPYLVETRDFADHWQISLDFLSILSQTWPGILKECGVMDAAHRRVCLIRTLAEKWRKTPPVTPVFAAGSTGSIPATANLLGVIAGLPDGALILPGLDTGMPEKDWEQVGEPHPQAPLKQLLERLEITRREVRLWPGAGGNTAENSCVLIREIMRPATTAINWQSLATDTKALSSFEDSLKRIRRYECAGPQEEALVVALCLRKALEDPSRTAALITPDRALARRVASFCRRWEISIDDSAGQNLPDTDIGRYLLLCAQALLHSLAPVSLLSLLRQSLCRAGMEEAEFQTALNDLELKLLRGPKPEPGFAGLRRRLRQNATNGSGAHALLDRLEPVFKDFAALLNGPPQSVSRIIDVHLAMAEALAKTPAEEGADRLWAGEAGEEAAKFFADLRDQAQWIGTMDVFSYLPFLGHLMKGCSTRPSRGIHPRLSILGQIEARLIQTDTVILSGLNEGTWPPEPDTDPWMSRPMRKRFGLPSPDRKISLAAHDFAQAFCAPEVILTRSLRVDGGPTVPARWLSRMDAVLQAAGISMQHDRGDFIALARHLDKSGAPATPLSPPRPQPPVSLRPRRLPVTKIQTWVEDPYAIYAQYILELKPAEPLEKLPDQRDRGILLHNILQRLHQESSDSGNETLLLTLAREEIRKRGDDPGTWDLWLARFEKTAAFFMTEERKWLQEAAPLKQEAEGRLVIQTATSPFTLSVRADRIDALKGGGLAILDYKSGGKYTESEIACGKHPQLALGALVLRQGGFADIPAQAVKALAYWVLSGHSGNKVTILRDPESVAGAIEMAQAGLGDLIALYDREETPYLSVPDPAHAPRFSDYAHLARVKEWTVPHDQEAEAS